MDTAPISLSDGDYVMALALLASHRSKDPKTQVGACLLNSFNKIVGIGYNGFPVGISDDDGNWDAEKKFWVIHAEHNAIRFSSVQCLEDCEMYVTMFPCNDCTLDIIQSRIKKIYYLSDKNRDKDYFEGSEKVLNTAKMNYVKYQPSVSKYVIDFEEPFPQSN